MKSVRKYPVGFYAEQMRASTSSARAVVPLLCSLVHPKSVLDIGCGVGAWLAIFKKNGASRIQGIEGPWILDAPLKISKKNILVHDLEKPLELNSRFDLSISLEVAEHITKVAGKRLVKLLTSSSDVVLFSAAVPGQSGTKHINEQWQDAWVKEFLKHDYIAIDCIRPKIWNNPKVEYWYAQNALLYVKRSKIMSYPRIKPYMQMRPVYSVIHPKLFERVSRPEKWLLPLIRLHTRIKNMFAR